MVSCASDDNFSAVAGQSCFGQFDFSFAGEECTGERIGIFCDLLRGAGGDEFTAVLTGSRA